MSVLLKHKRVSKLKKHLERCVKLGHLYGCKITQKDTECFENFYLKSLTSYGTKAGTNLFKHIHWEISQYVCKRKFEPAKSPIWMKRTKATGLPAVLKPLLKFLDSGELINVRIILTIVRFFETETIEPEIDFSTISDPMDVNKQSYDKIVEDYQRWLNSDRNPWLNELRLSFQKELRNEGKTQNFYIPFHNSVKNGIEGKTILNISEQSMALNEEMIILLNKFSKFFYTEELAPLIKWNQEFFKDNNTDLIYKLGPKKYKDSEVRNSKAKTDLGRIAFISDDACKTRLVAIGNYWIQNTLKPLHRTLYRVLRHLSNDGTYRQVDLFENLKRATEIGPTFGSDLSKATDRFPIDLQYRTLNALTPGMGTMWAKILSNMEFSFGDKKFKYSIGQPMGLYSSWATFTITHHCVVHFISDYYCNKKFPGMYGIVGDDNFLTDPQIAYYYNKFMESVGVKVNLMKSYAPEVTFNPNDKSQKINMKLPSTCEFVKRLSHQGVEVTGISPGIILQGFNSYWNTAELFSFLTLHGFADISKPPVSQIAKMLGLNKYQTTMLACSFRLNELLGAPSFDSANIEMPEVITNLSVSSLLEERIEITSKQLSENFCLLWDKEDYDNENLRRILGLSEGNSNLDNLAIKRIIQTQVNEYQKLEFRMMSYIPDSGYTSSPFGDIEPPMENPSDDSEFAKLKDLEYMPAIDFDSLMDGVTPKSFIEPKMVYRGRYIKKLIKNVLLT